MVNNYNLGGGKHGISAKPNQNAIRLGETSSDRNIMRRSMGYSFLSGTKGYTTFRLSENVVPFCKDVTSSDPSALAYNSPPCKGEMGNPKYVNDSSDYIRFKKLAAKNRNYNDVSFGGDESSATQSRRRMRF